MDNSHVRSSRIISFYFFFKYWLPPITLMLAIFLLSSRQSIQIADQFTINFIFFKSLHMIEYALLYFLIFRAFYVTFKDLSLTTIYMMAVIVSILYGASDELHQTFVPTREGTMRDVFIDTIGILIMFSYTKINLRKLKQFL